MSTHKITKSYVDRVSFPEKGQAFHRDSQLKGFALRVTQAGSRSFILEKRIHKKLKRITLGRYPEITVEMARKEALKYLGEIATGHDPIANRQRIVAEQLTLEDVWKDYKRVKCNLKPQTYEQYGMYFRGELKDWMKKPLNAINKDMVISKHNDILSSKSPSYANVCLRVVSAIFKFAKFHYEDTNGASLFPVNPVERLGQLKVWAKEPRRQNIITDSQLPVFYNALVSLKKNTISIRQSVFMDYLVFLLLTGLRKNEAATLKWENVDFDERTFYIADTKNGEPLTLPMSDMVYSILKSLNTKRINEYVFFTEQAGYLKHTSHLLKEFVESSGVKFTFHDLRRTFITVAESLDISAYAIKRLVNHRGGNDVTQGYVIATHGRLREPMQRITDYFKEKANMSVDYYE